MKWQLTCACKKNDPYFWIIMNAWWTQTTVATESGNDIFHIGTTLQKIMPTLISGSFQKEPLIEKPTPNHQASVNKYCSRISSQLQRCIKSCLLLIHCCLLRSFLLYYKHSTWFQYFIFSQNGHSDPDTSQLNSANQRPTAGLGVRGWPLEGARAISAGGRWLILLIRCKMRRHIN